MLNRARQLIGLLIILFFSQTEVYAQIPEHGSEPDTRAVRVVLSRSNPGQDEAFQGWYANHLREFVSMSGIRSARLYRVGTGTLHSPVSLTYFALYDIGTTNPTALSAEVKRRSEDGRITRGASVDYEAVIGFNLIPVGMASSTAEQNALSTTLLVTLSYATPLADHYDVPATDCREIADSDLHSHATLSVQHYRVLDHALAGKTLPQCLTVMALKPRLGQFACAWLLRKVLRQARSKPEGLRVEGAIIHQVGATVYSNMSRS